MTVYWILWISILLLADRCRAYNHNLPEQIVSKRTKHSGLATALFVVAVLLLIFITGCRYNVGTDFGGYYKHYYVYFDFTRALQNLNEPGIRLIYTLASKIHNSAGMCVFAAGAVTIGLQARILYRYTDNIALALVLFVFCGWTFCFNGVRQSLAVAVLFCGLPFLRDRKFFKYAIVVFLAYLCHKSAAVMILIYFITNRKITVRNVILLIIATIIVLLLYDKVFDLVNTLMENDASADDAYWGTSVSVLRVLTEVAPAAFFLWVYKDKEKNKETTFYLNLLIVHAVVGVATSGSACFGRMANYTMPFAVIAIAELVKGLPHKTRDLYVYLIAIMYWIMEYYEIVTSSALTPFRLRFFW